VGGGVLAGDRGEVATGAKEGGEGGRREGGRKYLVYVDHLGLVGLPAFVKSWVYS